MPGGNPGIPEAGERKLHLVAARSPIPGGRGEILTCFAAAARDLRLLFPRVLFEPPTSFKAGLPTEYAVGDVPRKWMKSQSVWIVEHAEKHLRAAIGICTHLGCHASWLGPEKQVQVPP